MCQILYMYNSNIFMYNFCQKSADIGIFLSKNNIKAIRSLVFQITEELMDIRTIPDVDIPAGIPSFFVFYCSLVSKTATITWQVGKPSPTEPETGWKAFF